VFGDKFDTIVIYLLFFQSARLIEN